MELFSRKSLIFCCDAASLISSNMNGGQYRSSTFQESPDFCCGTVSTPVWTVNSTKRNTAKVRKQKHVGLQCYIHARLRRLWDPEARPAAVSADFWLQFFLREAITIQGNNCIRLHVFLGGP